MHGKCALDVHWKCALERTGVSLEYSANEAVAIGRALKRYASYPKAVGYYLTCALDQKKERVSEAKQWHGDVWRGWRLNKISGNSRPPINPLASERHMLVSSRFLTSAKLKATVLPTDFLREVVKKDCESQLAMDKKNLIFRFKILRQILRRQHAWWALLIEQVQTNDVWRSAWYGLLDLRPSCADYTYSDRRDFRRPSAINLGSFRDFAIHLDQIFGKKKRRSP